MSLHEWRHDSDRRLITYHGDIEDENPKRKTWNVGHHWAANRYDLVYKDNLIDCYGEVCQTDTDIDSWEIKTCHVDGAFLMKRRQHRVLHSMDGGYILVLLKELNRSSRVWMVEDVIFTRAEEVDRCISGWNKNPSRFYQQSWLNPYECSQYLWRDDFEKVDMVG